MTGGNSLSTALLVVCAGAVLAQLAAAGNGDAPLLERGETKLETNETYKICITDVQTFGGWLTCCHIDPSTGSCSFPKPKRSGSFTASISGRGTDPSMFVSVRYPDASFWTMSPSMLTGKQMIHGGLQSANSFGNFTICTHEIPDEECFD